MRSESEAQKDKLEQHNSAIIHLQAKNKVLKRKLIEIEMYSPWCNLEFFGVTDKANEGWEESDEKVIQIMKQANLKCGPRTLERAHRIGVYNQKQKFPRPIIAKFIHYKDRDAAWETLNKNPQKGVFVWEDFPAEIEKAQKILLPIFHKAKQNKAYKAKLKIDKLSINGSLYTVDDVHKLPPLLQPENIFTPRTDTQVCFFTHNSPPQLSNMHPAPFTVNGDKFRCTEEYIAVQKCIVFGHNQLAQKNS